MKKLYINLFNACSEENQKLITNFINDTKYDENKSQNIKKYNLVFDNEMQVGKSRIIQESTFDIFLYYRGTFSVGFSINSSIDSNMNFQTLLLKKTEDNSLSIYLQIKPNTKKISISDEYSNGSLYIHYIESIDQLGYYEFDYNNQLKQKESNIILRNEDLMSKVFDLIHTPNEIKDMLLLEHDIYVEEHYILKNMCENLSSVNNSKAVKNKRQTPK